MTSSLPQGAPTIERMCFLAGSPSWRARVAWLVEAEVAAARQANRAEEPPSLVADRAARDALCVEPGNFRVDIVAHEVDLVPAILLVVMEADLRRRRGEEQPPVASVDPGKTQHIPEEDAVGSGIARLDDGVDTRDHGQIVPAFSFPRQWARRSLSLASRA